MGPLRRWWTAGEQRTTNRLLDWQRRPKPSQHIWPIFVSQSICPYGAVRLSLDQSNSFGFGLAVATRHGIPRPRARRPARSVTKLNKYHAGYHRLQRHRRAQGCRAHLAPLHQGSRLQVSFMPKAEKLCDLSAPSGNEATAPGGIESRRRSAFAARRIHRSCSHDRRVPVRVPRALTPDTAVAEFDGHPAADPETPDRIFFMFTHDR